MSDKKPWNDEPTPLCNKNTRMGLTQRGVIIDFVPTEVSKDLERRLRHARRLVGKLRADSECGDFDENDLEQRLAQIEETLTP